MNQQFLNVLLHCCLLKGNRAGEKYLQMLRELWEDIQSKLAEIQNQQIKSKQEDEDDLRISDFGRHTTSMHLLVLLLASCY